MTDDLRVDLMKWLSLRVGGICWDEAPWQEWGTEADDILALPALQRLVAEVAEARRLRETVERVSALVASGEQTEAETAAEGDPVTVYVYVRQLRRALDGTDG